MSVAAAEIHEHATDGDGLAIAAADFDLARHNGEVTIYNPATGQHRTFRVETVQAGGLEGRRIVLLLTGSDNTGDYQGFGFVTDAGAVAVWRKFRGDGGARSDWDRFAAMLARPADFERRGLEYHISGRCRRCNRLLTTPSSVAAGVGPVCATRG